MTASNANVLLRRLNRVLERDILRYKRPSLVQIVLGRVNLDGHMHRHIFDICSLLHHGWKFLRSTHAQSPTLTCSWSSEIAVPSQQSLDIPQARLSKYHSDF